MDENYTISDDLKACGLPGDDEDNLAAGIDDVLLRSSLMSMPVLLLFLESPPLLLRLQARRHPRCRVPLLAPAPT